MTVRLPFSTALLPFLHKYDNPPHSDEPTARGQKPTQAHWSVIINDLVELDRRVGAPVCQDFYNELQVHRGDPNPPVIERSRIVQALHAAEYEVSLEARKNRVPFEHFHELQMSMHEMERRSKYEG
jgi:hypothetical protein